MSRTATAYRVVRVAAYGLDVLAIGAIVAGAVLGRASLMLLGVIVAVLAMVASKLLSRVGPDDDTAGEPPAEDEAFEPAKHGYR